MIKETSTLTCNVISHLSIIISFWNHLQSNFNGSNTFGTMKISSSQRGLIIAPDQEAKRGIFSIFLNVKVYCVFSLESPH